MKLVTPFFAAAIGALVLIANSPLLAGAASPDFDADQCQLHMESAATWSTPGDMYEGLTFTIATENLKLDAPVRSVIFLAQLPSSPEISAFCKAQPKGAVASNDCDRTEQWMPYFAKPVAGDNDSHYRLDLDLRHGATFDHVYEGAFYVETTKGTRYWMHPSGGGNYFISRKTRQELLSLGSGGNYLHGREVAFARLRSLASGRGCR